ncbi:hypothetical protein EV360DRAFT_56578, partial [Lentinula raphanica]
EAFACDGVSQERLDLFMADPKRHGPKLRNTRLDKTGHDTKTILDTPWNRALIHLLAEEAKKVVRNCQDGRFGPKEKEKKKEKKKKKKKKKEEIHWATLFRQRLSKIVRDELKSRPLDDQETLEQRIQRISDAHLLKKQKSKYNTIRHVVRCHLDIVLAAHTDYTFV